MNLLVSFTQILVEILTSTGTEGSKGTIVIFTTVLSVPVGKDTVWSGGDITWNLSIVGTVEINPTGVVLLIAWATVTRWGGGEKKNSRFIQLKTWIVFIFSIKHHYHKIQPLSKRVRTPIAQYFHF